MLEAARHADLSRDLFLVLSDHGHLDGGGHLGLEPEVATVPVILIGAGAAIPLGINHDPPVAVAHGLTSASRLIS